MTVTATATFGPAPKAGVVITLVGADLDTVQALITIGLADATGTLTAAQQASLQAIRTAINNAMA